jgi:hypothetical protein
VGAVCSSELVEGSTAIYLKNALRAKLAKSVLKSYLCGYSFQINESTNPPNSGRYVKTVRLICQNFFLFVKNIF